MPPQQAGVRLKDLVEQEGNVIGTKLILDYSWPLRRTKLQMVEQLCEGRRLTFLGAVMGLTPVKPGAECCWEAGGPSAGTTGGEAGPHFLFA